MKTTVVRALATAGGVALAFAIGHSAQPVTAGLAAQPNCVVHLAPAMPAGSTSMAREHRVAV